MPVWERYSAGATLTMEAESQNTEIFHNEPDPSTYFQAADVVGVDGIVTVSTDTPNLVGVRLLVLPEVLSTGSITKDAPAPDDSAVWYSWFCANGPLVFRLRSKKTVPNNYKVWLQIWKEGGNTATVIRVGLQLLWVMKH